MITIAIGTFLVHLLDLALGGSQLPGPPGWASTPTGSLGVVFQALGSMGVWFNLPLMALVIGAAFAARMAGLAIKMLRMVLSVLTGGGGNAGGS